MGTSIKNKMMDLQRKTCAAAKGRSLSKSRPPAGLGDLPFDALEVIMGKSTLPDVVRLAATSKTMRAHADNVLAGIDMPSAATSAGSQASVHQLAVSMRRRGDAHQVDLVDAINHHIKTADLVGDLFTSEKKIQREAHKKAVRDVAFAYGESYQNLGSPDVNTLKANADLFVDWNKHGEAVLSQLSDAWPIAAKLIAKEQKLDSAIHLAMLPVLVPVGLAGGVLLFGGIVALGVVSAPVLLGIEAFNKATGRP